MSISSRYDETSKQRIEKMNKSANNIFADDLVKAITGESASNLAFDPSSIIMVIGVGGAGTNAVNHMQTLDITGVNFVVCNTDKQALENSCVSNKVQMGPGLGAGNDPERGRELALESEEQLRTLLETSGAKMLFIAAGMGGGTGTGASPVIAKLAHELDILTVAVVTMPLRMEGKRRYEQAVRGISELNEWVDSILIIDNERVRQVYGKLPLTEAFGKADDVLGMATKGIAELITVEVALVRVDFADVKTVMRGSGRTHMSVVVGRGENRALQVAEGALSSSLLDNNRIIGAKEILLNFAVADINRIMQDDITDAMEYIQEHASYTDEDGNTNSANIIWGACQKPSLADDELELVVVATRFTDGNNLNIKSSYAEAEVSPFEQPKEELKPVIQQEKEPAKNKEPRVIPPPKPPVTITPPQDRYKQIGIHKLSPAFVRHNVVFEDESNTQVRSIPFQQMSSDNGTSDSGNGGGGSLFEA